VSDALVLGKKRRGAIFAIFFIIGVALATWLARLPALRDNLDLETYQVGIFLFGGGAGSLLGLLIAAEIIARFGERRAILVFTLTAIVGMALVGVMSVVLPWFVIALTAVFLFGLGVSITDVAMNVQGARVERELSNQIMPWFHAMFSLGTVIGALIGAAASRIDLGLQWHFLVVTAVLVPWTVWAVRQIPDNGESEASSDSEKRNTRKELAAVWREPRTIAIGLVALGMAFAEGSATDWLALGMTDDRGASNATAAIWFMIFTVSMTVGRVLGVPLLNRYGRVTILSSASIAAVLGLVLLITIDTTWVSVVAVVLWGLGASLGFPVAMSAAADDPSMGPVRVSVVATIAYGAFLVGPPMLGALGQTVGILNSLWVVVGLIMLSFFAISQTKKPGT
jgi:fucose permease